MTDVTQHPTWAQCEEMGIAWARSRMQTENQIFIREVLSAWLAQAEQKELEKLQQRQLAFDERSARAAEMSAAAAVESAKTSATSARAAIVATAVSFFALVLAIAAYFKP